MCWDFGSRDAWQQAFDLALAVDSTGASKSHWGKMLPVGKDESPVLATLLLKHKLKDIQDWHALCQRHVEMNEGLHVLADARYSSAQGDDYWLNSDILRLDEEALGIIFGVIGHGQSRSVSGSFRHFLYHQIARAERIRRLPHDIIAYPSLLRKMAAAMRDVLNGVTELHASMSVRAFHLMQRALFIPKGSQAEKALGAIDTQLSDLKDQLEKAVTGQASHQALQLQTISGNAFGAGTGAGSSISFLPPSTAALTMADGDLRSKLPMKQKDDLIKALKAQIAAPGAGSTPGASPYATGIFASWGDAAWRYGVARAPEGIAFGRQLVQSKKATVNIKPGSCLASAAVSSSLRNRSQWCVDVANCANYAAHNRPDDTTDNDYIITDIAEDADRSKWQIIIPPHPECFTGGKMIAAPTPTWPVETGPGTSYDNSSYGGSKGKGKGKGGKGKDQTGRKRARPHFERLSDGRKAVQTAASAVGTGGSISFTPLEKGTQRLAL